MNYKKEKNKEWYEEEEDAMVFIELQKIIWRQIKKKKKKNSPFAFDGAKRFDKKSDQIELYLLSTKF